MAGLADGTSTRLTYWGTSWARVSGWTPDGEVLAVSAANQPFGHYVRARALTTALSGSPGAERVLPFGPVSDLSLGTRADEATARRDGRGLARSGCSPAPGEASTTTRPTGSATAAARPGACGPARRRR